MRHLFRGAFALVCMGLLPSAWGDELPNPEVATDAPVEGIKVGGAVRFQYSFEDYVPANRERVGDLDFDTFRINLDGVLGHVILSAELRYYQYMQVVHHAWVGYDFDARWHDRAFNDGIDNRLASLLPFIQGAAGGDPDGLVQGAVNDGNLIMAVSEAIAHLRYLLDSGEIGVDTDADGVNWYQAAD